MRPLMFIVAGFFMASGGLGVDQWQFYVVVVAMAIAAHWHYVEHKGG